VIFTTTRCKAKTHKIRTCRSLNQTTMAKRYDHRKLAFNNNPRWKKRRISRTFDLQEFESELQYIEQSEGPDADGGLLGAGKSTSSTTQNFYQKFQPARTKKARRGTY